MNFACIIHIISLLGTGPGKLTGRAFRIGRLGDFNDLTLMATLSGVEVGLKLAGISYRAGGARTGLDYLADTCSATQAVAA